MKTQKLLFILVLVLCLLVGENAEARRRRHRRKRYTGPPPTHPVILWSRALSEPDKEERKVAAFKLSQYSQTIYQDTVITSLIRCMKDPEVQIKVLCAKAMGRAGTKTQEEWVRKALLDQYQADPQLRNTLVRTFVTRKDNTPAVHDLILEAAKKSTDQEELTTLLGYLEAFGSGSDKYVTTLTDIYQKNENIKIKRAVVKALAERAQEQDKVIALFADCAASKDTPLALNCLSGLQLQGRKDARTWGAVEKAIESDDPDVLMATLDVINALPEVKNEKITIRLTATIPDMQDSDVQEKAVLALGVCGDHSEAVVSGLQDLLEDKETEDGVRVAAALVLGKQADSFPEKPRALLSQCKKDEKAPSVRLACQLGLQELESRAKTVAANPSIVPAPAPAANAAPRTPSEEEKTAEEKAAPATGEDKEE